MPQRPYHHGNLREALLQQAELTLRERGVQDLSLRELARAIGVSHGAPRRHFADRQALLDALAAGRVRAHWVPSCARAVDAAGEDFRARLHAAATAYVHFAVQDAALLELMFAGKHQQEEWPHHEVADRAFSVMFELILQGQAEGVLEPGDPERIGLVLFATIQGIASLVSSGIVTPEQLDELLADAVEHFLRGSRAAAV